MNSQGLSTWKFQDPVSYQLHGFCDSSLSGYAAVVYLRATSGASIQTAFVASKTRVAPLSQLTIPCLELLPALILARLNHYSWGGPQTTCSNWKDLLLDWFHNCTSLDHRDEQGVEDVRGKPSKGGQVLRTSLIMESLSCNRKSSRYPIKRHTRIKAEWESCMVSWSRVVANPLL